MKHIRKIFILFAFGNAKNEHFKAKNSRLRQIPKLKTNILIENECFNKTNILRLKRNVFIKKKLKLNDMYFLEFSIERVIIYFVRMFCYLFTFIFAFIYFHICFVNFLRFTKFLIFCRLNSNLKIGYSQTWINDHLRITTTCL